MCLPPKSTFYSTLTSKSSGDGGITSQSQKEPNADAPRGLGDFQRRSNRAERERDRRRDDERRDRERDNGYQNRNGAARNDKPRGWANATPRATPRDPRDDAPSVRVPNVAWDSTPRSQAGGSGGGSGWGSARDRRWDAPTPRTVRGGDDDDDGVSVAGGREWEEEQVKLDRDWYMGNEGGVVSVLLEYLVTTANVDVLARWMKNSTLCRSTMISRQLKL